MMQEVEVLKTIQELICSFFSEEQFTLSILKSNLVILWHIRYYRFDIIISWNQVFTIKEKRRKRWIRLF